MSFGSEAGKILGIPEIQFWTGWAGGLAGEDNNDINCLRRHDYQIEAQSPRLGRHVPPLGGYDRVQDVEGVELCGTLKNVVAIAAGFVGGLNMGNNSNCWKCSSTNSSYYVCYLQGWTSAIMFSER